jgi:peptidoglycan hydrolase-like protein with peptidoglycan-binding domain
MVYADAVVAQARLWVGYREGPNNKNVFSAGIGQPAEAWCQDFVQFVSASAGYKQPDTTPSVVAIGHWAQENKLWIVSTDATPGCQLCYDWNNGDGREPKNPMETHTGLYIGNGQTIEGNTGNPQGVWLKSRKLGAPDIWGAIDWPRYWANAMHPATAGTAASRFPSYPTIQLNSKGDVVTAFQRSINDVLGSKLTVDGGFGTQTQAACKQFQKTCRIPDNGVCGQQTWACLDIALDKLRM